MKAINDTGMHALVSIVEFNGTGKKLFLCFKRLGFVALQNELKMNTGSMMMMIILYLEYPFA